MRTRGLLLYVVPTNCKIYTDISKLIKRKAMATCILSYCSTTEVAYSGTENMKNIL
jgi:hypothetical protein